MLADQKDRLELLAALLTGERREIKEATGAGGVAGRALLLPPLIALSDDPLRNAYVYRYRVAWARASRATGLENAVDGKDALFDALASVLAVPATRDALHDEFPAVREDAAWLEAATLAHRNPEWVKRPGGALEALVRLHLGDPTPFGANATSAQAAWLADAGAARPKSLQALRSETERLLPGLVAVSGRGLPVSGVIPWGALLPSPRDSGAEDTQSDGSNLPARRSDARILELDRTIRLERKTLGPREDRPLFHVFEKLETSEDFSGQSSTPDPTGDLDKTGDAVTDLTLGTVVRTRDQPQNLVRADFIAEPNAVEVASVHTVQPRSFKYPEWNCSTNAYRRDWCTVVEERYVAGGSGAENRAISLAKTRAERRHIDAIRSHLLHALFRRNMRNRQADGPEIDVEAMVERHADLIAGQTPTEMLYLAPRKVLREVAILVLVDTSWSTDAWIDGRRVLDIAMGSLLVVAEAFEGYLEEEVAVAGFRSETRADVRFGVLKGFSDSWMRLREVAPGVQAGGYTRIGAAVRHSTAILDAAKARKKLLLVISDGKPTDYDRYEGRYGVEDVRHAIREANQRGIGTFGIAIEREAKLHLAQMLGPGAYRILPNPSHLPDVMADVFLNLMTR